MFVSLCLFSFLPFCSQRNCYAFFAQSALTERQIVSDLMRRFIFLRSYDRASLQIPSE